MGKDAILWMSLKHLIKIGEYRQYLTNEECILQFKRHTLLCNENMGPYPVDHIYHLTLDNQGMFIKYFYINKVYFPLGTSIETDSFN